MTMKKILFLFLLALCISAFANSSAHAVGAVVIQDEQCVLGEEASGLTAGLITRNTVTTETPSGIVKSVCTFNIPAGSEPDKKAERYSGFSCKIPNADGPPVITYDTHLVMTPGGTAVLTCKYKPE